MDELGEGLAKPRVTRRDFLRLSGLGTGAFLLSNTLIGSYLSNLKPDIPKFNDSLSEYKIPWQARPWVWINLAIASQRIDGTLIQPGKEISINDLLGFEEMKNVSRENTDPRKGYVAAQMSDIYKLDGWGYGLCLGSTALFRAALYSPLLIPERGTHYEMYPDYFEDMAIGTDAAVFFPDLNDTIPETDLRFKNPTNSPLTLNFRIYDEFGRRLEVPAHELSQIWYKASYIDQIVRILRRKVKEQTSIALPKQFLPEYVFGNSKIIVQAAVAGKDVNYKVNVSPVKHGDSTIVGGVKQYTFNRELEITQAGENKKYSENFISQYKSDASG